MKLLLGLLFLISAVPSEAQVWKVLPKGVRILGYRNVTTSKISSNFNQFRSESPIGASFKIDAPTLNQLSGLAYSPSTPGEKEAYDNLVIGKYQVDAEAQFNVHGTGFGYGLTDKTMLYTEVAYYTGRVKSTIKRTAGNTYEETARILEGNGNTVIADNIRNLVDANEETIQSVITNYYKYKPIGNWYTEGYGDMELGVMHKVLDKGTTGLLFYPGVILPTGSQDDPDILQDVGFGDGQLDVFGEVATGYVYNDHLSFGTTLRYTHQLATTKTLRVPESRDFALSTRKGEFDVKYGDKVNLMLNTTLSLNDWISFTPVYRFMYQMPASYKSEFGEANKFLEYNSDKQEHSVQLTTTFSSIQPFLKKEFMLPAQINLNAVKTVSGKNVPAASRFEIEFRMLF